MRAPSMPVNNKAMLQKLPLKVYRRLEEVVAGCPYLEWHHFDAGVVKVRSGWDTRGLSCIVWPVCCAQRCCCARDMRIVLAVSKAAASCVRRAAVSSAFNMDPLLGSAPARPLARCWAS
jgi:hypothetical protein